MMGRFTPKPLPPSLTPQAFVSSSQSSLQRGRAFFRLAGGFTEENGSWLWDTFQLIG